MRRSIGSLAFLVFLALPATASAQVSIWLQKGVSGFGASAGVSTNKDATGFALDGGYSYQGFLDFDLAVGYISPSNATITDLKAYSLAPGIQYHPIKQSKEIPVSVSLGANYTKYFYSSSQLSDADASLDGWQVGLNAAVYRFVRLGESVGVIPAAGVVWTHTETTLSSPGFLDDKSTSNSADVALGAYFAYIDEAGRIYGLVPSLTFGEDPVTFALAFNIIWSQP